MGKNLNPFKNAKNPPFPGAQSFPFWKSQTPAQPKLYEPHVNPISNHHQGDPKEILNWVPKLNLWTPFSKKELGRNWEKFNRGVGLVKQTRPAQNNLNLKGGK